MERTMGKLEMARADLEQIRALVRADRVGIVSFERALECATILAQADAKAAFLAGYHCLWTFENGRNGEYVFTRDLRPGDPEGAWEAYAKLPR